MLIHKKIQILILFLLISSFSYGIERMSIPTSVTDIAIAPNRPEDIADRMKATETAMLSEDESKTEQKGASRENIRCVLGTYNCGSVLDGAIRRGDSLMLRDAIIRQINSNGCFQNTARLTSNEYSIPVIVTLSSTGDVKSAELESGYAPSDDYEKATANNALRTFHHPNCQNFSSLNGQVEEGQQVTIIFQ